MNEPKIEFHGAVTGPALRARLRADMAELLAAWPGRAATVRVGFSDENGPKGGEAIRCALEVRLPRRRAVRVEDVARTARLAFAGGLTKLERRLRRTRETARDSKRRPKKYFVAKRVLSGT